MLAPGFRSLRGVRLRGIDVADFPKDLLQAAVSVRSIIMMPA
jgi:hypothetical protein